MPILMWVTGDAVYSTIIISLQWDLLWYSTVHYIVIVLYSAIGTVL